MYIWDICSMQDVHTWDIIMNYDDIRIERFLMDMYEISCIESFKFFSNENNYDCREDLEILKENKKKIVYKMKEKLFETSKAKYKSITYMELFNLFKDNFCENVKFFFNF